MDAGAKRGMKEGYPSAQTLIIVFAASFLGFYYLPPMLLSIGIISKALTILGTANAVIHQQLLTVLGIKSISQSNILWLSSGAIVEYSPYCFGLLTITAFGILVSFTPNLEKADRIKWVFRASILLAAVNQGRIIIELLIASAEPSILSTVDRMFYPVLPITALVIWRHGLKNRMRFFEIGERGYARG